MHAYTSFVIVAVIAFLAPLIRAMWPAILVPAIVLELVGGIIVGPHGIGIASSTGPVNVFSTVGLACLLFLAGREIQVDRLRGPLLTTSIAGFGGARTDPLRSMVDASTTATVPWLISSTHTLAARYAT